MIAGLPLMKNMFIPLAKGVLIPLRLTAAESAADAKIYKILASGTKTLIISDKEREGIMRIVKSPEESGLLVKGVNEKLENEVKQQKGVFLSTLLGTLNATSLGNLLAGNRVIRAGDGTITARQYF